MTKLNITKTVPVRAVAALVAGLCLGNPALAGDRMELTIAPQEIPGTSEIQAGKVGAGITKLERALSHANHNFARSNALVNLCAAYTIAGDLQKASSACSAAADTGANVALAYNNQAVINCIQGNVEGCVANLERAANLKTSNRVIKRNLDRARSKQAATYASNS